MVIPKEVTCLHLQKQLYLSTSFKVLSIELETFSAVVEVIDDDEPLYATKRLAALIELYPIDHGNGFIDGWILADDLDKFRFFFVHMWYPWDETDGSESWTELVLKRRLDLLYDMVTGELSEEDSTWIRNLIAKARWNQVEIDKAADAIDEGEDSAISNRCNGSFDSRESNVSEEEEVLPYQIERMDNPDGEGETKSTENEESHVARLYELQKEMKFIQEEVELLASSSVRKALAKEKLKRCRQSMAKKPCITLGKDTPKEIPKYSRSIVAISGKSSIFELQSFLRLIEARYQQEGKCEVEVYPKFQFAKDVVSCAETTFVLCSGFHSLNSSEDFLLPGTTVGGISSDMKSAKTTIFGHSLGRVMIIVDWSKLKTLPVKQSSMARLENICFDPVGTEAVLLVECGSVSIKQCSFVHEDTERVPLIGDLLLPSTSILSSFERFGHQCESFQIPPGSMFSMPPLPATAAFEVPPKRGIAVGAGGKLVGQGCCFEGLHIGIIIYSKAKVYLSNCKFVSCQVAIKVFKGSELTMESCSFENSGTVSIQVFVGCPDEQEEAVKDIMKGQKEVYGSSSLLDRISGIDISGCIFISGEDVNDVILTAYNETNAQSSFGGNESS
ncbi:protein nessun dorma-like isoform X2 [Ischnura elegans]|uniref:protein nessun dorma-like isoform X2 n=1 Tax=Ischnura elegans TaxID=197161 RepID=UPI001ED87362|nr:protein nessun dorma-like isoform X2 [Ischnura elegans]